MNLNQSLLQKKKVKNHVFGFSTCNAGKVMGPPLRPLSKAKNRQKSNSSTSSKTTWGKSCVSVLNSSTLRSGSTTLSSEIESRVILGLTEGRGEARCEVGLASIDLSLPTLLLCQISDSQSYINTLTKINILNPTDIIVPSTFLDNNNRLVNKIRKKFPDIKILGITRRNFNKSTGMDRILQLALPSVNTICVGLQHKYYALAAASALTTYLQHNLNIYYARESINVCYQESEGYAVIDVSTADRLELVSSTKPAQASRYSTLFGVLNHCVTKVGSRLLRSTILQPPSSPEIIESNLNCVTELIRHPEILHSIQATLQKISNIDQLLTLTSMYLGTSDGCSARQLNYLLLLNGLIDLIEPLIDVITKLQQPFFKELATTLQSEHFVTITAKIRTMIHPAAHLGKSEAGVTQRCFAIKSGINGLLDLVRKTYSERLNDLSEYVRLLADKYNLALSLGNNNLKGYHIVLKLQNQQKRSFKTSDLPGEFVQVCRLAGSCTMKTAELINYSTRVEDIMVEILKISNSMIYNLIVEMKQYLGFFYKLCENIARFDTLQSLAEASRRGYYTRPKFANFTELTNSRHPMLEMLIGEQRVANPISMCEDFNVQVITGPNGSGKSIYIRQVMLLQIMAQVGCYVPADSAIFRPMNRMFARIYFEDDLEYGASSFILEMKEIKYMMTLIDENSLFIIDELCRSTAVGEGASLAMAICEKFCTTGVFLYVTTHYTSLANLRNLYLNVKTWNMETEASGDTPQELSLDFKFRLIPGVTNLKHYGVYIVKKIWPQAILDEVYQILNNSKGRSVERKYAGFHEAIMFKYRLESDLRKLKYLGKLTMAKLNQICNDYQNELHRMLIDLPLDVSYDNEIRSPDLETSSYRNMSNFLREDSDNINKLIPDVIIGSSERELRLDETENFENDKSDFENESLDGNRLQGRFEANNEEDDNDRLQRHFEPNNEEEDEENEAEEEETQIENFGNEQILAQSDHETTRDRENIVEFFQNGNSLQMASTPTIWGSAIHNLSSVEIQSVIEELESVTKSFREDDDEDFEFSITDGKQIQEENFQQRNTQDDNLHHVYPVVKVVAGPEWSQNSSQSERPRTENTREGSSPTISISYSPLCTQSSSIRELEGEKSPQCDDHVRSHSGSSQFLTEVNGNSDTNLENVSRLRDADNITIENLKSLSDNKQSSSGDQNAKTSSSSSEPSAPEPEKWHPTKRHPKKFVPPRKLTRKEIQDEFDQQDRKLYDSALSESDLSKYLEQRSNRPSVRQLQNLQHLSFVRKTEQGVEVIPATPVPIKKRLTFKRNLSSSSNNVDMTIFSDKNAKCFDEFLNSEERDVKRFKCYFEAKTDGRQEFNFRPSSVSEYAARPESFLFRSQASVASERFQSVSSATPDGYYKQNKDDINNIMNKYLGVEASQGSQMAASQMSIFETCSINEVRLDL